MLFQVFNLCLNHFIGNQKPTKRDLIAFRKKDGSKLEIMSKITRFGTTACKDLATMLLGDDTVVRKLHREAKDDDMFICDVFDNWLNRDDEDTTDSAVPCTWEELCSCIEYTPDLPGSLVKDIKDHFCS